MNLKNFSDGLAIIRAFYAEPDGYQIGAEHDQIFLYATAKPMDEATFLKLREMGWFQDEAKDADVYEPLCSWSAFV